MKFFSILVALPAALAQTAHIIGPAPGTSIPAGSSVTVQVARPPYIQSQNEVAIALGLQHCLTPTFCDSPSNILGTQILYKGPYNPTQHPDYSQRYENFTVMVPNGFPTGTTQIGMARYVLLGVSNAPYTDYLSSVRVTVT